jgi:hypothetical protein
VIEDYFFSGYYDIDMKFSPPLTTINLYRVTYDTNKVGFPPPNNFFLYTRVKDQPSNHLLNESKTLATWTNAIENHISILNIIKLWVLQTNASGALFKNFIIKSYSLERSNSSIFNVLKA